MLKYYAIQCGAMLRETGFPMCLCHIGQSVDNNGLPYTQRVETRVRVAPLWRALSLEVKKMMRYQGVSGCLSRFVK